MGKAQKVTYTLATLDRHGRILAFLKPNYTDPGEALENLRRVKTKVTGEIGVLRSSEELLDEDGLIRETQLRNTAQSK